MADSQRYAELLTQVLRQVATDQPSLQNLKIRAVCDVEAGQFLLIGTGWEQTRWMDLILFHAWLHVDKVVVEENSFESIADELVEAGIAAADIISADELLELERSVA